MLLVWCLLTCCLLVTSHPGFFPEGTYAGHVPVPHSGDAAIGSERCFLRLKDGLCKANFLRWFYNPRAGRCEQFVYGGCGGNANNFLSYDACRKACKFGY